jgi:hypothetical protein
MASEQQGGVTVSLYSGGPRSSALRNHVMGVGGGGREIRNQQVTWFAARLYQLS